MEHTSASAPHFPPILVQFGDPARDCVLGHASVRSVRVKNWHACDASKTGDNQCTLRALTQSGGALARLWRCAQNFGLIPEFVA